MAEHDMSNFKPNSHKYNEAKAKPKASEAKEEKEIKKVVKGKVIQKKKSFAGRFVELFFNDDLPGAKQYLIYDLIVPGIKQIVNNTLKQSIDLLFYGEVTNQSGNRTRINYSGYSQPGNRQVRHVRNMGTMSFDDIILETRPEAEELIDTLIEAIDTFGNASVADLYDALGESSPNGPSDNSYGWTNLSTVTISRVREGYLIKFPRVESLK